MDANRDAAAELLERARAAIPDDLPRAQRLLDKSRRLYPYAPLLEAQARVAGALRAATPAAPARDATPAMEAVVRRVRLAEGHYAVLGLEKGAGDAEVKKAFRKLALSLHPDKNVAEGAEVRAAAVFFCARPRRAGAGARAVWRD